MNSKTRYESNRSMYGRYNKYIYLSHIKIYFIRYIFNRDYYTIQSMYIEISSKKYI